MNLMAVLVSPLICTSVKAGTHTRLIPLGAR